MLWVPRSLYPPLTETDLRDVSDAAKVQELKGARLKLQNDVRIGLRIIAPDYIWMFWAYRHYKPERVVAISASVDAQGQPQEMKLVNRAM